MSIVYKDFEVAIKSIQKSWEMLAGSTEWDDVRVVRSYDISFLRIRRRLSDGPPAAAVQPGMPPGTQEPTNGLISSDDTIHGNDDIEEIDDEALPRTPLLHHHEAEVIYDIIHSPTYQVPVLYLTMHQFQNHSSRPLSLEQVYELLAPPTHHTQMQSVGVMGALTQTEHPVTGAMVWFVHPCRTGEAMEAVTGSSDDVLPEEYLMKWFGLVGASVGLNVPVELAVAVVGGCKEESELRWS